MPPFAAVVAGQIRFLLQSCGDSDFDPTYRELCQFVEHGIEGSVILLQLCLDQLNHNDAGIQNVQRRLDLVSAIFRYLLERPNFSTILCEALGATSTREGFLENLSSTLNLSVPEKIGVGLALSDSDSLDIRTRGQNFCIVQIDELCANPTPEVSNERIQEIIMFLHRAEGLSKHVDSFIKILSLLQLKESSFFALAPMLPDDMRVANSNLFFESSNNDFDDLLEEIEKEMSMADIVRELGYGCTVNTSHCKEMLSLFLPLNEATLSKLLSTIARTHIGLEDAHNTHSMFCSALLSSSAGDSSWSNSWNVDVLVDSIKELAPNTKWTLVMENLDHDGFYVHDETSLSILMSIYHKACQDPFPLHAICGSIWKNTEGQLSFLKHAVSAPPSVFTFAHSSRQLTNLEMAHLSSGHGNGAWYCLDLLEVLCQLAERGHAASVRLMLEYPLNHCPEVLLVGMSKIDTAYNLLQYEVSSTIFPEIFKDRMKSSVICHLWHVNPNMVLQEFLNLHYADENSLLRIMEICQELKILPSVLDITPSPFCIKLAAIASQKEHLNLEKWLNENLSTHTDAFLEDCLKFLKETLSNAANDPHDGLLKQSRSAVANIYQETCSIFLKVLQAHSEQIVSHQLFEEIKSLHVSSSPRVEITVATELTTAQGSSDDIEAEANAYFHQMFSEQLSIDAMVQMLFRLKESSDKREQMIFDCIIANLFEEYKFFPKYPDRQLKLAAILFGSLIKHQLVTHLTLGIALRGVLDALRKSVDSKMFLFGTTALEQFMDRLVEWPQYCNHILQISHFRGAHAELVSVIERALAQVSSSQAELNGGNSLSADQQQGSAPPSVESMEASEASWPLVRSSSMQSGQQLSPFQQQWHQGILDDRFKTSAASANYTRPLLSHTGQSSIMSAPADSISSQKATALQNLQTPSSQHSASGTATVSSSPGFLRPSRSITPAGMLRQSSYSTGFGAALNIETLVAAAERRDTPIEAPASEVQDKILFMINNISTANMDAKAKEFTEVLKEQYYPWFAQYMVMKRASIEPNFHDLYLKFLDKVNSRSLNKEIVKATYENCKVLLRSDLIKSSSEERSLLKNLGSWLGKFTIGRNQALRAREIDPKILIIEAYEKGLMIAVIPFTSKILEPCQCSLAYQPPNPWTMGILGLLTEIYNLPNLKMNLKFDIEVLFKNLGVDMKEVKPTSLLKDRAREVEGNPDFSNKDIGASQPAAVTEMNSGIVPTLSHVEEVNNSSFQSTHSNVLNQGYNTNLHIASNAMAEEDKSGPIILTERVGSGQGLAQVTPPPLPFSLEMLAPLISSCEPYIRVNPNLTSMGMQLQFHRIIQVALDRAIKDILSPVIQRSVTIASRTTKELVLKDYAMESDGNAISSAARMMVGRLAGSLAHVTCKEPLRGALSNHLRSVLQALNVGNDADQIVQIITTDHLDLGCAVIENVATHKAMELIDGEIAPSFASLRKQREAAGTAYYDAGTYAQGSFACVPETLRPKPGHLSFSQQQVYKDFARNTWQTQTISSSSAPRSGAPSASAGSVNNVLPRVYSGSSGQLNASIYSTSQTTPGLGAVSPPLDLASEESDRGQVQHISVSSAHVGADEAVTQQSADVTSFPATVNPSESNMLDTSTVTKEMVGTMPPTSTSPTSEHLAAALPESLLTTREVLDKYQLVAQKLVALIGKDAKDAEIQVVVSEVPDILLKCVSRDEAAMAVAQKVFKGLYESMSNSHITTHLAVLAAIRDVCKLVVKELTSWVIYSDEERKFNKEITIGLIRSELLNLAEYNVHLAKLIDGGRNKAATEFAISLVQALVVQEPGVSTTEFYNLIEALEKLSLRPGSPESLQQLLEIVRNASTNGTPLSGYPTNKEDKARLSRDKKVLSGRTLVGREENNVTDSVLEDPPGFRDQVSLLFAEWCRIYDLPGTNDAVHTHYISQLQQNGWLKGDDVTEIFFRILMELSVSYCVAPEQSPLSFQLQPTQQTQQLSFIAIDTYAKLVVLVMKYCLADQGSSKVTLLPKILAVAAKVIQKDAEEKKAYFNPRPYFRLFINLLLDLASLDPVLDTTNFQVLTAFASVFHVLQPLKVPGWSFAWLELVSHKSFMPKLLTLNSPKGWPFFQRLLVDLFKFMEPYLRNAELGESVRFLYKGTLRVLLVLLHDFPGFLCEYHFSFCDVIPPSCIQMRNVILSAFPRNMRLPDPSTPNLKIDLLAEISQPPRILSDVDGALKAKQIKADIDEYLKTRAEGSAFMVDLKQRLLLSPTEASMAGTRYNVPLLNSLVLYVGMQAIQQLQSKSSPQHASTQQLAHNAPMDIFLASAAMDIFQNLIKNLDTEGRYLFLNAVANQLRYPNNHTHYFSFVLLYLFAEASQDIIQEQITRVLLERLIVNRPHPWGLLITFIELIKNPRYSFWSRPFTRCAPEIEKLFESVSRSCGGPKAVDDGMVSGGIPDGIH